MGIHEIDRKRKAAGLTQKQLCKAARVNPTTYSQLKKGKRGALVATLERLAAALPEQKQAVQEAAE